jgi:hypothetical protein
MAANPNINLHRPVTLKGLVVKCPFSYIYGYPQIISDIKGAYKDYVSTMKKSYFFTVSQSWFSQSFTFKKSNPTQLVKLCLTVHRDQNNEFVGSDTY